MNHLKLVHLICKEHIQDGHIIVDATVGNGHDTLFLAKLIENHKHSKLYGYDIQAQALTAAKKRLGPLLQKVEALFCSNHETLENDFTNDSINLILFNLGYLPGSNKQITTKCSSTLIACNHALNKLTVNGLLLITAYPGHHEGKKESIQLKSWIESLKPQQFKASCYTNAQVSDSPYVIILQKLT